ncbi:MAG: hypothetical protein Q7R82_02465 [Candidatus Daviesbacteria bacterium]|nr:hypothetical protein [Candidatus Daviesbacteria bacterium]
MIKSTTLFLTIHAVILISIFTLRFFGFSTDHLLAAAAALISLEAIYVAFFIRSKANKTECSLRDMEKEIAQFREDTRDAVRAHREILYAGHQIKTLQMDLDVLKKTNSIKLSGNGHSRRIHSQAASHS